ncbi:10739_t:CDS:2 [Acaulospora colombiana]|uniref:10739_t:CDS:1 n=1 Tax=Acaulospora colombiana TaxID=27376 RepID=A0ACA9JXI2_9GLOM|nr:10739_t:CDS:2 [Acaulospora colombiana]
MSWVLQAETELDLKDWISCFESAKRHAFSSSNDLASSAAATVIPHKELGGDTSQSAAEDGEHSNDDHASTPRPISENSQNDSLELPPSESRRNSVNNANIISKRSSTSTLSTTTPGARLAPQHSYPTYPPPLRNQGSMNAIVTTNNGSNGNNGSQSAPSSAGGNNEKSVNPTVPPSSTSSNQQNFWGSIQWGIMPAMNMLINSVNGSEGDGDEDGEDFKWKKKFFSKIKNNRSRSGSGPVGFGIDGWVIFITGAEYPQILMAHNLQLHLLFEDMSEREFLLDVYQGGLVKDDNLFRGRVYFTQDRLYFYSVVMSVVNKFYIPWREIKLVSLEATNPQQIVAFSDVSDQKYVIKFFLNDDRSFYEKALLIWRLVTGEKVPTLQGIYDALWNESQNKNAPLREANEKSTETSEVEMYYSNEADENNGTLSSEKYAHESRTQPETDDKYRNNDEIHGNHDKTPNKINHGDSNHENEFPFGKNSGGNSLKAPKPIRPGFSTVQPRGDEDQPSILPTSPVACGCFDHLEKLEVEVEYPVSARKLYQTLFENSSLWERMHQRKRHTLQYVGAWAADEDGVRRRELRFIMSIPIGGSASKAKETECIETHTCQRCDDYT